ncbi:MAG: cytochrome c peroxidase [Planctomycetota bacterium]|jgi:cytochrome c peroxidase
MVLVARTLLSLTLLVAAAAAQAGDAKSAVVSPEDSQVPKQANALTPSFAFLKTPPKGLPAMPLPQNYVPTEAMFALGKRLFHDGILSKDHTVTCASCHLAANGFAHPDKLPPGVDGKRGLRHAPSLFNRGYGTLQRWDGSSASIEAFVLEPIEDPNEMDLKLSDAIARLRANADYKQAFAETFASEPNPKTLRRSLATFVRGIVTGDAPYDRFLLGEVAEMTAQQRHGQWIFESKGACWKCHTPPLFTDEAFHNTGVGASSGIGASSGKPEPGRMAATKNEQDAGKWKTPTLRSVRMTAPYMHDGSLATLEDVVAFYVGGGNANSNLDRRVKKLDLSKADQEALIAFLRSL